MGIPKILFLKLSLLFCFKFKFKFVDGKCILKIKFVIGKVLFLNHISLKFFLVNLYFYCQCL